MRPVFEFVKESPVRQPHPEVNFRLGRGRARESARGQSPRALLATMKLLGITTKEEQIAFLKRLRGAAPNDKGE